MDRSTCQKVVAVSLGVAAVVLGVGPTLGSTAAAECTSSDCEESEQSAESEGELERARELRDRGIELMDEDKEKALELDPSLEARID